MIYVKYGFVGLLRRSSRCGWAFHLPAQPRLLGPRKVNLMASNATPARREGLLRATRKVIEDNREVFTKAGKRLGKIYSEKHLKQHDHDGKWDDNSSEELVFPRLDWARLGVVNDDYPLGYTDMRFEEPMPQAERKLAASMVVLTLVLAIDPDANEYISESMCPFAALPWYFGEEVPGLLGRGMIGWIPSDHNSVNSPPGEVLDLLERATGSARTGEVMPEGLTIPTGDGQPCEKTEVLDRLIPNSQTKKASKRKSRRTMGDKIKDEATILVYLEDHPDAKRDEIVSATGIPAATVSGSRSWKNRKAMKSQDIKAGKTQGIGGVGDPSVQSFGDDIYDD